jgi:hypothetical protein
MSFTKHISWNVNEHFFDTKFLILNTKMYEHFWDQVLPQLTKMQRTYSTPYAWNIKEQRFSLICRLSYLKTFKALSLLISIHTPLIFWNLLQTLRHETNNLLKIYGFGYMGMTSGMTVTRWMHANVAGEIVQLLNLTVPFQKLSTNTGII